MKKLTLKLEELAVESFQTVEGARGAGSVHANEDVTGWQENTCVPNCPGTDWETCRTCDDPTCRPVLCP